MTSLSAREREDDSFKSWAFGIDACHEIAVRRHDIRPRDAIEQKWWDEGFTSYRDIALRRRLETVRGQQK